MMKKSEFGKGLTYCIGLFLAHKYMFFYELQNNKVEPQIWFCAASDHIYELDTRNIQDKKLKDRIEAWMDKVMAFRSKFHSPQATLGDIEYVLEEAAEILREIDEKLLWVKTIKGENE